jgi:hypothetical protein
MTSKPFASAVTHSAAIIKKASVFFMPHLIHEGSLTIA